MSVTTEQALRTKALAASGVTALIGQRWYSELAIAGDEYPLVVADVTEQEAVASMAGNSGWTVDKIALYIWGKTHESVVSVAEQLRLALHGKKDNVTVGVTTVKPTILLEKSEPCTAARNDGGALPDFGICQTYTVSMAQAAS